MFEGQRLQETDGARVRAHLAQNIAHGVRDRWQGIISVVETGGFFRGERGPLTGGTRICAHHP